MKSIFLLLPITAGLLITGCQTWLIDRTDREVYRLIDNRQTDALGTIHDARLGPEAGELSKSSRTYSFNPRPLEAGVPESFRKPRPVPQAPPEETEEPDIDAEKATTDQEMSTNIFSNEELDRVIVFSLQDALSYAMRHGRDLQDAKEDLYLAALDLTLERHLWTPQFVASFQADFTNFPDENDLDRALTTVSEVAVSQRLRYGGDVTARVIHSLVREVLTKVSKGENGQVILSADLPLLRGAGNVAYESRFIAERELIYAVRRYERFRRTFLVSIASDYFALQQLKTAIANTHKSYLSRKQAWEQADFIHRVGRSRSVFDAPRARSLLRSAEADLVSAKERYETTLDRFKIRIGMDVENLLTVVDQDKDEATKEVDRLLPDVDEATAADVAVRYRLDLINSLDQLDDTRRGVLIAKNQILPDFTLSGSLTLDSDPNQLRGFNFRKERITWQGGVQFRLDDRKTEQNAYRASLVSLRRAQRDHEEFSDAVRADVRRALRQVAQQEKLRRIQEFNVTENESRLEAARAQFDLGRASNQAVIDAEDDLLRARNNLARSVSDYRIAILAFRRDTGTLRITDQGRWDM